MLISDLDLLSNPPRAFWIESPERVIGAIWPDRTLILRADDRETFWSLYHACHARNARILARPPFRGGPCPVCPSGTNLLGAWSEASTGRSGLRCNGCDWTRTESAGEGILSDG